MYTPVKVPSSQDAHLQAMAVGLEAANTVLSSSLCTDPMLPLEGMLAIFQTMLDSLFVAQRTRHRSPKQAITLLNGSLP